MPRRVMAATKLKLYWQCELRLSLPNLSLFRLSFLLGAVPMSRPKWGFLQPIIALGSKAEELSTCRY